VKNLTAPSLRISAALIATSTVLSGCGTNVPTIPAEYLTAGCVVDCGDGNYPSGPYGNAKSDTIRNLRFPQGWMDPAGEGYDTEELRQISLEDFHNADDPSGFKLILLNSSALWCQACKVEHRTLSEEYEHRRDDGFVVVSALFQNGSGDPAEVTDLVAWTTTFESTYPMAIDPEGQFGTADTAPLNYVIDAQTMKILRIFVGDQAAVMWGYIDQELEARQ
jgi:hypothetical protein